VIARKLQIHSGRGGGFVVVLIRVGAGAEQHFLFFIGAGFRPKNRAEGGGGGERSKTEIRKKRAGQTPSGIFSRGRDD